MNLSFFKRIDKNLRVGVYVPEDLKEYGSVRIRGTNLAKHLSGRVSIDVLKSLNHTEEYSHLILPQKTITTELLDSFSRSPQQTVIVDLCELFTSLQEFKLFCDSAGIGDILIAASYPLYEYLKAAHWTEHARIFYVPDIVEVPYRKKKHRDKSPVKIFWYGFKVNFESIHSILDRVHRMDGVQLVTMSNSEIADHHWDLRLWVKLLQEADIGISPIVDDPGSLSIVDFKSAHKILSFMANGIPVIASSIGEYRNVIEHNINGMLIQQTDAWEDAVRELHNHKVRRQMGEAAFQTAKKYSGAALTDVWLQILTSQPADSIRTRIENNYIRLMERYEQ